MELNELYDTWYNGNTHDPEFVLLCYLVLQNIKQTNNHDYRLLKDSMLDAMEDLIYDYK